LTSLKPVVVQQEDTRYDGDMLGLVAGFDIGGTKISLVVSDSSDERMYRLIEATDSVSGMLD